MRRSTKLRASGAIDAYADILMRSKRGVMLLGVPLSGVGYVSRCAGRPANLSYFKGKKIRSIPLYDPILQALGATPVTTSPAEAYTAMERGVGRWSRMARYRPAGFQVLRAGEVHHDADLLSAAHGNI